MGNNTSREKQGERASKYRSTLTPFNSTVSLNGTKAGIMNRFKTTSKHKKTASFVQQPQKSYEQTSFNSLQILSQPTLETPPIDKYADSQMTLSNNSSRVDSMHTASNSLSTLNTHMSETEMARAYSSELMLKELYLLCDTSPERIRDRDRRHRQHYLLKRIWGSNYRIPLKNPTFIIDWCCTTAAWDLELAVEFPDAKVLGIDYETTVVTNLNTSVKNFVFQSAMIYQGETGLASIEDNQVDYIVMRDVWLVNCPVNKWSKLLEEVLRILKPGGYIEIYEQDTSYQSIGPYLKIMEVWADSFYEAIKFDRNTNNQLGSLLECSGFVNIQHEHKELPLGEWPEDKVSKETGYLQKDLTERYFREAKRWLCRFNNVPEKEYAHVMTRALDECEDYKTSIRSLYFSAQKPS